jgi:hypothetical protein
MVGRRVFPNISRPRFCFEELRAEQGGGFVSATDDESASQPDYDVGWSVGRGGVYVA